MQTETHLRYAPEGTGTAGVRSPLFNVELLTTKRTQTKRSVSRPTIRASRKSKMNLRHAASLALVALVTCSCLTSCATFQVVQQTTVESQDRGVVILTYKDGWFAPLGDQGQGNAIATEICIGRGYSGATTLDQYASKLARKMRRVLSHRSPRNLISVRLWRLE
jgi:hypothetical protein